MRALAVVLLAAAACASAGGAGIEGVDWRAVSVAGAAPHPNHAVTLRLDGGSIIGSGGCNGYSGEARIEDGRLVLGQVLQTAAACLDPVPMRLEGQYVDVLRARPSLLLLEGRLVMTDGTVEIVFEAAR